MNNIKTYQETSFLLDLPIKELQNIPVHFFDKEKFEEIYEYSNDKQHNKYKQIFIYNNYIKACFVAEECPDFLTPPFIMILKGLPIEMQIFTFFHEYGHYICYNNKCSCTYYKQARELHAWKNSFKLMLHYKCYKSLTIALKILDGYKKYTDNSFSGKDLYDDIVDSISPSFRKIQKWVKNCPKKYKNSLIRID